MQYMYILYMCLYTNVYVYTYVFKHTSMIHIDICVTIYSICISYFYYNAYNLYVGGWDVLVCGVVIRPVHAERPGWQTARPN